MSNLIFKIRCDITAEKFAELLYVENFKVVVPTVLPDSDLVERGPQPFSSLGPLGQKFWLDMAEGVLGRLAAN